MSANTATPMERGTPSEVVNLLQVVTNCELASAQRESAEIIIQRLGSKATITDFVESATQTPGLETFAEKVGEFCLPDHSRIWELEVAEINLRLLGDNEA